MLAGFASQLRTSVSCSHSCARSDVDRCCMLPQICQVSCTQLIIVSIDLTDQLQTVVIVTIFFQSHLQTSVDVAIVLSDELQACVVCFHRSIMTVLGLCCLLPQICQVRCRLVLVVALVLPGQWQTCVGYCHICQISHRLCWLQPCQFYYNLLPGQLYCHLLN